MVAAAPPSKNSPLLNEEYVAPDIAVEPNPEVLKNQAILFVEYLTSPPSLPATNTFLPEIVESP